MNRRAAVERIAARLGPFPIAPVKEFAHVGPMVLSTFDGKPGPASRRLSLAQRVARYIDYRAEGCWEWRGARDVTGYGRVRFGGRLLLVHRAVYELVVGAIPAGLQIDHLCRNRSCCNPDHLEPVTRRENILRGVSVVARNAVKTHCIRGHEFTLENTRATGTGNRACRACEPIRARALAAS